MKALRVHDWGQAPQLEDMAEPAPPGPGRSLVRMHAASMGHIDHTIWSGGFGLHPPLPYVPGTEAAGVVVAGERFSPGTRVWLRGGGLGTRRDGSWREYIDTPDEAMGELPADIPYTLGASFFSPCTAAWCALHDLGRWQPGERILVTGASGAVGSIALQLARECGAQAFAVRSPGSAPPPSGAQSVLLEELRPDWDLLIDGVGGEILPQALRGIKPGGRAVLVGYTAGEHPPLNLPQLMLADVALLPLNMMRREADARALAPQLLARLADGRLQLAVEAFALGDGVRLLPQLLARRGRGRSVLTCDEPRAG
jgi:NADPH2:quinone reductase